MTTRSHRHSEQGFTLIEAIVSMVIIGTAALPIMLLISQSLDQLTRVAEANARAAAIESALAIIDPVNPALTPSGEIDMGDVSFTWDSEVLVPPNETVQPGTGLVGFFVSFHSVEVEFIKESLPWFSFSTRKVGYTKIQTGNPFGAISQ